MIAYLILSAEAECEANGCLIEVDPHRESEVGVVTDNGGRALPTSLRPRVSELVGWADTTNAVTLQ